MIKKFNDFKKEDILNNEISHYERELNARKKRRENLFKRNQLNFNDISNSIKEEINNNVLNHISIGKKILPNNIIINHIQYDSDNLGRIIIYKPNDNSNTTEIDINDKTISVNSDDVRLFYHYLTQIIINKN